MNTLTNVQIINGIDGNPAFVVIPYADYVKKNALETGTIPNEVVGALIKQDVNPIQAWREYLQLTRAELATRLDLTLKAYTELELQEKPLKHNLKKIAVALGITVAQLNV